jgi:hypothetical protein
MAEAARTKRSRSSPATDEKERTSEPRQTCPVTFCPICIALTGTQPLRAEFLEHLLKAGHELLLAVQAATSAGRHEDDPPAAKLEKIELG